MAYTVKDLAKVSGVSVRTLHFYDEIGLLKPAYHGTNGTRLYEEKELLKLQQILFFRELKFELKQIQKILGASNFNQLAALTSHKLILEKDMHRTKGLIETIDKTIERLQGRRSMKDEELYEGFSKETQEEYLQYWKNKIGENHPHFVECKANTKNWSKKEFDQAGKSIESLTQKMKDCLDSGKAADSDEMQELIRQHYDWLKQFWTPDREAYIARGEGYTEFEWKKFYKKFDPHHPKLASFQAEAMRVFAEKNL